MFNFVSSLTDRDVNKRVQSWEMIWNDVNMKPLPSESNCCCCCHALLSQAAEKASAIERMEFLGKALSKRTLDITRCYPVKRRTTLLREVNTHRSVISFHWELHEPEVKLLKQDRHTSQN